VEGKSKEKRDEKSFPLIKKWEGGFFSSGEGRKNIAHAH